jgi:hypothetical protein
MNAHADILKLIEALQRGELDRLSADDVARLERALQDDPQAATLVGQVRAQPAEWERLAVEDKPSAAEWARVWDALDTCRPSGACPGRTRPSPRRRA